MVKIKINYGSDCLHICSTQNGSSGSPLINDDLEVIGIHKSRREKKKKKDKNKKKMKIKTRMETNMRMRVGTKMKNMMK